MSSLKIIEIPLHDLHPASRNARRHLKKQIRKLADGIRRFGFLVPVIVDALGRIIAGHARYEAAKLLGMATIPVIRVETLSPAQVEAFAIFENRISDEADWDRKILMEILHDIEILDASIDLTVTGLDTAEIDSLYLEDAEHPLDAAEAPMPACDRTVPAVSRLGDTWKVDEQLLTCGSALDPTAYAALMWTGQAQMVISDLPYNVKIQDNVSGLGVHRHAEFPMASGEMSVAGFTTFLQSTVTQLIAHSVDGSIHYLFMDFRHMREMLDGAAAYSELKNLAVWTKTNAGMGSLYRSQHELVFIFKSGTAAHINNVELGRHGRHRSNVWRYPGANAFGKDRDAALASHPTVKPVAMIADAILDCSDRGGIILDPFLGSGTTLIAAARTGRRGRGIELDPYYVDLAVQRVSTALGVPARHVSSGMTFDEIREARSAITPGEAA